MKYHTKTKQKSLDEKIHKTLFALTRTSKRKQHKQFYKHYTNMKNLTPPHYSFFEYFSKCQE
jgi:hypothetical protein